MYLGKQVGYRPVERRVKRSIAVGAQSQLVAALGRIVSALDPQELHLLLRYGSRIADVVPPADQLVLKVEVGPVQSRLFGQKIGFQLVGIDPGQFLAFLHPVAVGDIDIGNGFGGREAQVGLAGGHHIAVGDQLPQEIAPVQHHHIDRGVFGFKHLGDILFLFIFLSAAGNQKKQKGKARQKRVRFHGQKSYLVSFSRDNGNKCIKNCPKWRLPSVFNIVFSFSRYHSRHDDEVPYRIRTELALFVSLLSQTDLPDLSHLSTALDHRSREKVSPPPSKFPRPLAYPAASLSKKNGMLPGCREREKGEKSCLFPF